MTYFLDITDSAKKEIANLKKSEPQAFKKLEKLLYELQEHPTIGTGKPKQLHGVLLGKWSRRITDKHRLVYEIREAEIVVLILSVQGHYNDK